MSTLSIKKRLEQERQKQDKIKDLLLNPKKLSDEELEEIAEELDWKAPTLLPHSRRIETEGMSQEEYNLLLRNIKKRYGDTYWTNRDFQRVFGNSKEYTTSLLSDIEDLAKSQELNTRPTRPLYSSTGHRIRKPRK